jgi:hypothetical protein
MNQDELRTVLQGVFTSSDDLYVGLNALRDWVNRHLKAEFDFYLEDAWNESEFEEGCVAHPGETWLEYRLRSLDTRNETDALAYDVYANHQDERGVWHLDDYRCSILREPVICDIVAAFILANRESSGRY